MKTILVPTDLSSNAENASKYAIQLALQSNSKIVFFHATNLPVPSTTDSIYFDETFMEEHRKNLIKSVTQHVTKIYKSLNVTREELTPKIAVRYALSLADAIEEFLNEQFIDMIVMGTHGASGLKKVFIGSNATKIMDRVKIPLLVIPGHCSYKGIEKIAYASDLIKVKTEIKKVYDFAHYFNAVIDVVHTYPNFPENIDVDNYDKTKTEEQLQKITNYDKIKITFSKTIDDNNVEKGLENYIKKHKPDIVIMFKHKRSFWQKVFEKSYTKSTAYTIHTPLLEIKK